MAKQKFKIGDKVTPKKGYYVGKPGIITYLFTHDSRKRYCVIFDNKYEPHCFWSYELLFADLHALAEHYEKDDITCGPKEIKKCQLCGTPFDEIEESKEEPGTCEYCIEQRNLISEVNMRKAANVDLGKFSIFGHKGDWLEVTEWTNGEGFDVLIHYASDHDETNRDFMLSYDEFTAIANIVNKFGRYPIIFTKPEKE